MVAMDIMDIPREDSAFDIVLCSHVLEHVPDDKRAIREIYRVLKPGGWAILQVPMYEDLDETYENWDITTPEGRLEHFDQKDHVRKHGRDYLDRIVEAGFTARAIPFAQEYDPALAKRFGFKMDEKIYRAKKPAN